MMKLVCVIFACLISATSWAQDKHLDEVVVTATGTEHQLRNTPVHTEVISRKMLDTFAGKSIEEILGSLTASFTFNEGDMGSQMQLNGLGNNYILILVDGKRLHGDNGGENDLGLIDPQNIDHIEIVKGAQSALYGSDAIAGVVNIITRKAKTDGLLIENTSRFGSYLDIRQHNGISAQIGKLTSNTNLQIQHNDGWQNTSKEYTEAKIVPDSRNMTANKFTNWQLSQRLTYAISRQLSVYGEGWFYRKNIYRPTDGKYPSCDVHTYDLEYRNASASAGTKWLLNDKNHIDLDLDWNMHDYYYAYTSRTYEDAYINDVLEHGVPFYVGQKRLQSSQQRAMAQLKGVFHLHADNLLSIGAEYRYDYLNSPMRVRGQSCKDWTSAIYAQNEFSHLKWLNITAGVRLIYNKAFGIHVTPKLSAMISLGDFRIRAGWGQGFKTPTPKELNYFYFRQMGSSEFFYMGNMNLKPQTSNNWSLNVEYRNPRLTLSVTSYLNRLSNMIALVNIPVGEIPLNNNEFSGDGSMKIIPRMYKNSEDAKTYGLDFNVSFSITNELTVGGNYSLLDTEAHVFDESNNSLRKVIIDGMAHHKWNAFASWIHRFAPVYRLGIGLYTRGSSERFYENNGNGAPFQIWRISTTHDFGKYGKEMSYRVELGVDNIFNYRDTTIRPYHLGTNTPGTTVHAGFSIKFNSGKKLKNNNNYHKIQNSDED